MSVMTKAEARRTALARRKAAHAARDGTEARLLTDTLASHAGRPMAGYWPIRSEIDPRDAMTDASAWGPLALPVITGAGLPLTFRVWHPKADLEEGPFGAAVPASGAEIEPDLLIVPLVAFDRTGTRLGYGGGFYDRTLERLRGTSTRLAIGFAYAAQEVAALPREPTDQQLDLIVTDREVIAPR